MTFKKRPAPAGLLNSPQYPNIGSATPSYFGVRGCLQPAAVNRQLVLRTQALHNRLDSPIGAPLGGQAFDTDKGDYHAGISGGDQEYITEKMVRSARSKLIKSIQ